MDVADVAAKVAAVEEVVAAVVVVAETFSQ